MKAVTIKFILAGLLAGTGLHATTFPLSENNWSNPEFVQRFLGSYGFDTATTPSITSEERALFESIAPFIANNPQEAINRIRAALKPDSSRALHYTLGNLYFQTGRIADAIAHYEEAIKGFPNFLRAYKNLGIVYVQEGKYENGIRMLLKTVELGGQDADVFGLIGFSYLNTGNASAALRAYEQALFFAPNSRDWRMGKVQALSNLHRYRDAIAMIDELLTDFPAQTDLLLLQANAFIALNEPVDAAAALEIVRARGKASPNALMLLGDIYLNFLQPDLALQSYRTIAEDNELSVDRAFRIARRLAASAAWTEVEAFLDLVEANSTADFAPADQIELLNLRAQSDLALNKASSAAQRLARVVELDPMNGKALLLLGNYHWTEGNAERAEIYFERAAKVQAVAPDALVQHARMLVSLREFRRAVTILERAQMLRPQPHVGEFLEKVAAASRATGR